MPGIFGIVQAGMRPEAANHLTQNMIEPLIHFPWYQWAKENWRGATLGVVSLGILTRMPRCLMSEDERYVLAFEGELYNAAALQKELGLDDLQGEAAEIQAVVVLRAMQRWGAAALNRFNGLFQIALWDSQLQELILCGDRAGLRPIYLAQQKDKFAFAPEVKALLTLPWVSREIDYRGILSFLRHGFCLGQHTFFQNVQVLPPGSFAVFRRGQLQIRRYWKMEFPERAPHGEKEIRQRFIETWTEVMQAQTGGDYQLGLPLSGGVDSRLILASLLAQSKNVLTFTMGNPGCKDAAIAQRLAETAKYPNLFSPIVPSEIAMGLERSVYVTDGMFNCFHANVRRLLPSLVEAVNMVYDGITSLDSLYDPEDLLWRRLLRKTDPTRWLHAEVDNDNVHQFRFGAHPPVDLIASEAQSCFHDLKQRDFLGEFVQAQKKDASNSAAVVDLFWLEEFQHRFFAFGPQILRTTVEVRCPFFDQRILELIGALTPQQRSSDKPLQRHAIHALKPALARIPWERTGLPLTAWSCKTHISRAFRVLRRKTGSFIQHQMGKVPQKANADKMIDYDAMIRTSPELRQRIAAILLDQWTDGSRLFDRENLRLLLDQHLDGAGNYAEMIGRLLTVEIWHQLFVRETARHSRRPAETRAQVLRMAA
jgi:asparagine synthetase B (glutamine-hydrolysing)